MIPESKSLNRLLGDWSDAVAGTSLPGPPRYQGPDVAITGFVEHSDLVEPGMCFVARVRTGSDGHPYIDKAIKKGAALIIGQRDPSELDLDFGDTPYYQVRDSALVEAWLAAAWNEFPTRYLTMIGVTGTDGKTTTVNILFNILRSAGLRTGMLSTIKAIVGDEEEPLALHVTTPEAPVIQAYLRRMVDAGLTHCVLEATSHGLAQNRVAAIDFDLAIVTNITHEHLDYHGDYKGYFDAKARLFKALSSFDPTWKLTQGLMTRRNSPYRDRTPLRKMAILNRDDQSYRPLASLVEVPTQTYGLGDEVDVGASGVVDEQGQTRFVLRLPSNRVAVKERDSGQTRDTDTDSTTAVQVVAPLSGRFNVYNLLAAAAAASCLGLDADEIAQGMAKLPSLRGRMEPIKRGQPFKVFVDFAHTPNALEQALAAARSLNHGRLIAVFGSAGKRDVAKRKLMAQISARAADLSVLTAEDPRTESLEEILDTMAQGCRDFGGVEGKTFWRIKDRGRAIYLAFSLARPGDTVLIFGKGHEQSMCFGTIEYPWDDVWAACQALDAFLAGKPMVNLGLPTF